MLVKPNKRSLAPSQPHENSHLDCQVETEGLRRSIQNLGVLITTGAVGHTSVATGEGLRHALVSQHTTVTVTTKDKDSELVKTGNAALRAEIVSMDGAVTTETEVVDNKNGTYEVRIIVLCMTSNLQYMYCVNVCNVQLKSEVYIHLGWSH